MDTVQLKGVDSTKRVSSAKLGPGATIVIKEKIMTHGHQTAETSFDVSLDGAGSSAKLISRSVARDFSRQLFRSKSSATQTATVTPNVMPSSWITAWLRQSPKSLRTMWMHLWCMRRQSARLQAIPAGQADDPWADRKRSGSADYQRLPEITQRRWAI